MPDDASFPVPGLDGHRLGASFRQRYRVEGRLGEGAHGVVLAARQLSLDRSVAIKFLHVPRDQGDAAERLRRRFLREAAILARLTSPHVVRILDHGMDGTLPFIVEELLVGRTLEAELTRRGHLEPAEAILHGRRMAEGLAHAHAAAILHRDLKPANVFLTEDGGLRLLDFGLSTPTDAHERLTQSGVVVGTPMYLAPEAVRGQATDERADLYALGVMLFQMLTGSHPHTTAYPAILQAKVELPAPSVADRCSTPLPPDLAALVDALLQRDPGKRPQTAAAVAAGLSGLTESPSPAPGLSAMDTSPHAPILRSAVDIAHRRPLTVVAVGLSTFLASLLAVLLSAGPSSPHAASRAPSAAPIRPASVATPSAPPQRLTAAPSPSPGLTPSPTPTPSPTRRPPTAEPRPTPAPLRRHVMVFGGVRKLASDDEDAVAAVFSADLEATAPAATLGDDALVALRDRGVVRCTVPEGQMAWTAFAGLTATALLPAADDVAVTLADGTLASLDGADGRIRWRAALGLDVHPRLMAAGDLLLGRTRDGGLAGVDLAKGLLRLALQDSDMGPSWCATTDGLIHVTTKSETGLRTLDPATGRWVASPSPLVTTLVVAGPLARGTQVAVVTTGPALVVGSPVGPPRLVVPLSGTPTALGAVDDDVLVTLSRPPRLIRRALVDGRAVWTRPLPDESTCPPLVRGATVLVALRDGTLRAFSAATGAPVWMARRYVRPEQGLTAHPRGVLFFSDFHDLCGVFDD